MLYEADVVMFAIIVFVRKLLISTKEELRLKGLQPERVRPIEMNQIIRTDPQGTMND